MATADQDRPSPVLYNALPEGLPDPAGPPGPKEPLAIVFLGTGLFIGWSSLFYLFGALYLVWEQETAYSKADLSLAFTLALLMAALVAPVAGRVVDAGRGRILLAGGAIVGGVGLSALAWTTTYTGFLLAWLAVGIAQGSCLYEPTFTFLARVLRQRARRAVVLVGLLGGLSTAFVYPMAAWVSATYDWRVAVFLFAILNIGVMAPLMYAGAAILEPGSCHLDRSTRRRVAKRALGQARRQPTFWILLCAFCLMAFCEGLVLAHAVPALVELGESETVALLSASLIGPFQFVARVGLIWIGVRATALPLVILSIASMAAGTAFILLSAQFQNTGLLFATLFGCGYGVAIVLKPVLVSECLGYASIGALLGAMALPYYFALAIAPYAGSLLWEQGGYGLAITVAAGVAATSALGFTSLLIRKFKPRALLDET